MAIYKCKMCGGDLEITQGLSVCECLYCGSRQTLPKLNDDKKRNMYDRAGHFRRNNEYDKAIALYEQILNEDAEDAESYWSLVLCRYGIEYVEEPASHRRVPTVNRAQFTSVFADENYKAAIRYAAEEQRGIYEEEAKEIDRIQKEILEISEKEKPFDVFICYKESDANGRRTQDSVLATELYHQLTKEGINTFFARITLEDKLGSAYEPYIFAALNSAKVMVVLGTRKEHFEAVWVKNEWSRYLALIKGGAKKVLIPAYRDMDPYDLPDEFSYLQAQDMSKLGFMQDLIRGIRKIAGVRDDSVGGDIKETGAVGSVGGYSVEALLKRAYMFLEDGEFGRADRFAEQVLNVDPENANAYVVKLMVERKLKNRQELSEGTEELSGNNFFQKAIRFSGNSLKGELERYNDVIIARNKDIFYEETSAIVAESKQQSTHEAALQVLATAINRYESILGWRDSEQKISECRKQQEQLIFQRKNQTYEDTVANVEKYRKKKRSFKKKMLVMKQAAEVFRSLGDFRDSEEWVAFCTGERIKYRKVIGKRIRWSAGIIVGTIIIIVSGKALWDVKEEASCFDYKEYADLGSPDDLVIVNDGIFKASSIRLESIGMNSITIDNKNADLIETIELIDCDMEKLIISTNAVALKNIELKSCYQLKELIISDNVTSLENITLDHCKQLCYITISDDAKALKQITISCCDELIKVQAPENVDVVFLGADSWLYGTYQIPNGVTSIADNAFWGSSFSSIELPSGMKKIGEYAFSECEFMSIELPPEITSIGRGAFENCRRLKFVYVPGGVLPTEEEIFEGCTDSLIVYSPQNSEVERWAKERGYFTSEYK